MVEPTLSNLTNGEVSRALPTDDWFKLALAQRVRVEIDNQPWFVAADVCKALTVGNTTDALVNLDQIEVQNCGLTAVQNYRVPGTKALAIKNSATSAIANIGQTNIKREAVRGQRGRPMVLVSEAGLYTLVMRSDKPEAKAFQDWVTGTVLPAIRKDGGYIKGEEKMPTGNCPNLSSRQWR